MYFKISCFYDWLWPYNLLISKSKDGNTKIVLGERLLKCKIKVKNGIKLFILIIKIINFFF